MAVYGIQFKAVNPAGGRLHERCLIYRIISSKTLAKLSSDRLVKMIVNNKVCVYLGCQPNDIIESVRYEDDLERCDKFLLEYKYNQ